MVDELNKLTEVDAGLRVPAPLLILAANEIKTWGLNGTMPPACVWGRFGCAPAVNFNNNLETKSFTVLLI